MNPSIFLRLDKMALTHSIGIIISIILLLGADPSVDRSTSPRVPENTSVVDERLCGGVRREVVLDQETLDVL